MKQRNITPVFYALIAYTIAAVFFTWPLVTHFSSAIFGDEAHPFDTYGSLYDISRTGVFDDPKIVGFDQQQNYPFGVSYSYRFPEPLRRIIAFARPYVTPIAIFNSIILFSFPLGGLASFLLCRMIGASFVASLFGGFIFGFCPYHTLKCFSHHTLTLSFFIPLSITSFIWYARRPSWPRAGIAAGIIFASCFVHPYFGYITGLTGAVICTWIHRTAIRRFGTLFLAAATVTIASCFLLTRLSPIATLFTHPTKDLFKYAASWGAYVTPSEYTPSLGAIARALYPSQRQWNETTLYLGVLPLAFSLLYAFTVWKRKSPKTRYDAHTSTILCITGGLGLLLSLGPTVTIGSLHIWNFPRFLFSLFPMFRVYARFGIIVVACISTFAALGMTTLLSRVTSRIVRLSILFAAILCVYFEFRVSPPARINPLRTSAVYPIISADPTIKAIAEYPIYPTIDARHYAYLLGAIIHKKPLLNGAPEGTMGRGIAKIVADPSGLNTLVILNALGINTILAHTDALGIALSEGLRNSPYCTLLWQDKTTVLVRIDNPPAHTVVTPLNFYSPETRHNKTWSWMRDEAYLMTFGKTLSARTLSFDAQSFRIPRQLVVEHHKRPLWKGIIDVSQPTKITCVIPAINTSWDAIAFRSTTDTAAAGKYTGTDDTRLLSVAICFDETSICR